MSNLVQVEIKLANGTIFTVPSFDASAAITDAPYFTYYEVANPSCTEATKLVITPKFYKHYKMLSALRKMYGKPFTVNSGYRSPTFNKSCGGIAKSNHVYGTGSGIATDIARADITTDAQFAEAAKDWQCICESNGVVGECLWYRKSRFIHYGSFIDYSKGFYKVVYNK